VVVVIGAVGAVLPVVVVGAVLSAVAVLAVLPDVVVGPVLPVVAVLAVLSVVAGVAVMAVSALDILEDGGETCCGDYAEEQLVGVHTYQWRHFGFKLLRSETEKLTSE
jgi:hypothetical protein